ncbi:spermine/spermidine synthase domain-containing protein [Methylomonas sp. MgM2]
MDASPRPSYAFLLGVSMISASALAYEVLLMRLFSIIQWHHFAYMIISLALLGYGFSGVVLALNRERWLRNFPTAIIANMLLFGFSAPCCFLLAQHIEFHPAQMLWVPSRWLSLCAIYLLLAIPFFFAANVVGLSFYFYKARVSLVYTADLLGAGTGSIGIILLLFLIFPEKVLLVVMLTAIAAATILVIYAFPEPSTIETGAWFGVPTIFAAASILLLVVLTPLDVSPYKSQNQLLRVPGTKVIDRYSSPLGVVSVVSSGVTPLRHAPGLSLNATAEPPEQLAVFTDADNMTAITAFAGNRQSIAYLDQTTSALPYHLKPLSNILILGAGTGSDVLQADYHAVPSIDAVELNPQVADLVRGKYADFAGHLYRQPNVSLHIDEARGYLAGSSKVYDLIELSLLDAFGASAAGLYAMSETYLYTEQAVREYLRHLKPDGYLSLTRWVKMPPRDEVKLLATVIKAMRQSGMDDPGRQMLVIRGWQTSTLVVKNGRLSADEIVRLKQFCNERSFDPVYFPGIAEAEVNRFNIQQQPYLYQAMTALLGPQSRRFIEHYKFDIEPVSDDKPYLFHFFKWRTLPESLALFGKGGSFLLESGYLLSIAALSQALCISLLLIVLPLWLWKDKLGIPGDVKKHLPVWSYFFCLGLAFLFVEIGFIQKFILILHHPLYAITVVLSTFLLAAGLGSYFSRRFSELESSTHVHWPIAILVVLCLLYAWNFDLIAAALLKASLPGRYVFSVLLIALMAFFMGMPFPMGLAKLAKTVPSMLPWVWGINGFASVISAILATLIAMQFGFTVLIGLAIALYLLAAGCFLFFNKRLLEESC